MDQIGGIAPHEDGSGLARRGIPGPDDPSGLIVEPGRVGRELLGAQGTALDRNQVDRERAALGGGEDPVRRQQVAIRTAGFDLQPNCVPSVAEVQGLGLVDGPPGLHRPASHHTHHNPLEDAPPAGRPNTGGARMVFRGGKGAADEEGKDFAEHIPCESIHAPTPMKRGIGLFSGYSRMADTRRDTGTSAVSGGGDRPPRLPGCTPNPSPTVGGIPAAPRIGWPPPGCPHAAWRRCSSRGCGRCAD